MFGKKFNLMVLESDAGVDSYTRIAANNNLQALYKIGVYGKERQHELYLIGKKSDYKRFLKAIKPEEK